MPRFGSRHTARGSEWDERPSALARAQGFATRNFLPLVLVCAIVIGLVFPAPGLWLSEGPTSSLCIAANFGIAGLGLQTAGLKDALSGWRHALVTLAFIMAGTGAMAFACLQLPLSPDELGMGLAVFCCVPTTLTSCVILTKQANGHWPLSLMLTVTSNVLGTVTVPFLVSFVLHSAGSIDLDPVPLLQKLMLLLLLPISIGKGLRVFRQVREFRAHHTRFLSMLSSFLLAMVPLMQVSKSAEQIRSLPGLQVFLTALAGAIIHLIFLAVMGGYVLVVRPRTDVAKAVVITGAQKTLPVALTVLAYIPEDVGAAGPMAIACVLAHFVQIVIDSVVVAHVAESGEPYGEDAGLGDVPMAALMGSDESESDEDDV